MTNATPHAATSPSLEGVDLAERFERPAEHPAMHNIQALAPYAIYEQLRARARRDGRALRAQLVWELTQIARWEATHQRRFEADAPDPFFVASSGRKRPSVERKRPARA